MNRSRWFTAGVAMLATAGLHAQQALPPGINFFGGELPPPPPQNGGPIPVRNATDEAKAVAGYAQTLVFGDDRELHGELVEMTRDEVTWRRPDTNDVLRFPRSAVRRIVTDATALDSTNGMIPGIAGNPFPPPNDHATLKLPGGDWLCSKVTSADGQNFRVQLNDGTQFPIARTHLEWIHLGVTPVPAFGFSGTALDMEGWGPPAAKMEMAGQTLTVKGAPWIGRMISPPNRFEISFELPADSEEGMRLWLQPFGAQPNSYGTGTMEIRFGRKEISHLLFVDKFEIQKAPLPSEALNENNQGPGTYRVFYDGTAKRVLVWRNGHQAGDWNYFDEKNPPVDAANRTFEFSGICFDRESRLENAAPLKFNRLRIQPWDGTLPKAGETEDGQDRLSLAGTAEVAGKLESMTDKELVFSGATKSRQGGSVVRFFGPAPVVLTGADTKLEFGDQGEFIARNVQVRDGKVRCETSFSSALELPLSALQNITFPAPAAQPEPAPIDMLVFKNADELIGHALSAALPGPLRWRTFSGQEVEFQPGSMAGVRLSGASLGFDPKIAALASTLELRSGERLRGRLVALDEKQVQVEHPLLGSIGLERSRLWHLYPEPRIEAVDGGQEENGWAWKKSSTQTDAKHTDAKADRCIYLDGTYVQRRHSSTGAIYMSYLPGVERAVDAGLERYEVRMEAASAGSLPNFTVQLAGQTGTSLHVTIYGDNLRLVMSHATANRPPPVWHNLSLAEKLGATNGPRAVRLFVDTKTGTCDLMINGVRILRLGQNENERLQPSLYTVKIQPSPNRAAATVFSNIWIGPWNGELPSAATAGSETTALSNGDVAKGTPKALHDGTFTIASDLGDLDLPVEKTLAVDFGGAMDQQKIAARLRLADGTILNVDRFQWEGHEWAVHSTTFGDLRLPGGVVGELVYDPAPAHEPAPSGAGKLAQKNPGEPTHD